MTYGDEDYLGIAQAVGAQPADLVEFRPKFEAAAIWYRLDRDPPKRVPPSKLQRQLVSVSKKAKGLLKALGINDLASADDGLSDAALLAVLTSADGSSESAVLEATRRVARLAVLLEAAQGAIDLERMAANAGVDVDTVHREIVRPGHQGEAAVNNWIAAMLSVYRSITGREPGTSVGGPENKNRGKAGGPLIRFLIAAGAPLGLRYSAEAWRKRVRLIVGQPELQD
jgi:hypothetical protein